MGEALEALGRSCGRGPTLTAKPQETTRTPTPEAENDEESMEEDTDGETKSYIIVVAPE